MSLRWVSLSAGIVSALGLIASAEAHAQCVASPVAPTACTPERGYEGCLAYQFECQGRAFTVPAGATSLRVDAWGAGGGGLDGFSNAIRGGAGGHSAATFSVTPGETLNVVVGEGGPFLRSTAGTTPETFGGGGGGRTDGPALQEIGSGGGYSGVFRGAVAQANALLIAGGGGGCGDRNGLDESKGGNGNNPLSGGHMPLLGETGTEIGTGGGGGGYVGGIAGIHRTSLRGSLPDAGEGGSGFAASSAQCRAIAFSDDPVASPPGVTLPFYVGGRGVGGSGGTGGHGLVVLQWTSAPLTADCTPVPAPTISTPTEGSTTTSTTPEITGACADGATVTVRQGASSVCTATCTAAGSYSCTPRVPLVPGTQMFTAQQTLSGVTSGGTAVRTFIVLGPPTISTPVEGGVTSSTPAITGSCVTGATVTVVEAGATICTTTCAAGGFSCMPETELTPGSHTITATQTLAGATSAATPDRTFTVARCTVDSDCADTEWCPDSRVCALRRPNGEPIPSDGPANGECSETIGTRTCSSGVCSATDHLCGLPNFAPCTMASVCRSAICAPNRQCGECDSDDDCASNDCDEAAGRCRSNPDAGAADAGPADAGPADAGPADAGPADAGSADAGPADAGPADAGPTDAAPSPVVRGAGYTCTVQTTGSHAGLLGLLSVLGLVVVARRRRRAGLRHAPSPRPPAAR